MKFKNWIIRHQKSLVFLLPIVVILFIYRKVLFEGYFFGNGDTLFNFIEYFKYRADGGSLVSQQLLSGFPVQVSVTGVWFYPLNRLALFFLSPFNAYKYLDVFNLLATYILTYWYARKINLSHYGAVFAGLFFLASGQLMLWSETLTNTNYYPLLPAALLACEYLFLSATLFSQLAATAVLGVFLGVGWLSGHVQYVFYVNAFVFFYFIFLTIKREANWARAAFFLALAYIISFLVGKAQILAILGHRAVSARSSGVGLSDFFGGAYLPQDLIHFFVPFYKVSLLPFSNPNLYFGILPLALLVGAFVWRRRINASYHSFFLWVFAFCFIASFKYSPIGYLLHALPFANSFREAPRIMFLGAFAAAIVSAFALEYVAMNKDSVSLVRVALWTRRLLYFFVLPVAAVSSVIHFFFEPRIVNYAYQYFLLHRYSQSAGLPKEHYLGAIRDLVSSAFAGLSVADVGVVALIAGLAFLVYFIKRVGVESAAKLAVFAIVFTSVCTATVYGNYFTLVRQESLARAPATATFLNRRESAAYVPYRYMSILPGLSLYNIATECPELTFQQKFDLQKELLQPNSNMLYGLDSVDGYDNYMPRAVSELLAYVGSEQSVTGNLLANEKMTVEERIAEIAKRKDVLRMMNVKYLVSHYEIKDPAFKEVFNESVGPCASEVKIYELSDTWPRFFVTPAAAKYEGLDALLKSDLSKPAVFGEGIATSTAQASPKWRPAQDLRYEKDGITFLVVVQAEQEYLYIGNAWLPNYVAAVDGKVAKIEKANHGYMYVQLPKGLHAVRLMYVESSL